MSMNFFSRQFGATIGEFTESLPTRKGRQWAVRGCQLVSRRGRRVLREYIFLPASPALSA